jgi:hypothetical protein
MAKKIYDFDDNLDLDKMDPDRLFVPANPGENGQDPLPFNVEDLSDKTNFGSPKWARANSTKANTGLDKKLNIVTKDFPKMPEGLDRAILKFDTIIGGGFRPTKVVEAVTGRVIWENQPTKNIMTFKDFKEMVTDLGGNSLLIREDKQTILVSQSKTIEELK